MQALIGDPGEFTYVTFWVENKEEQVGLCPKRNMGEGETEARELIAAASLLWWCPPQVFAVVTTKDRPNGIGRHSMQETNAHFLFNIHSFHHLERQENKIHENSIKYCHTREKYLNFFPRTIFLLKENYFSTLVLENVYLILGFIELCCKTK